MRILKHNFCYKIVFLKKNVLQNNSPNLLILINNKITPLLNHCNLAKNFPFNLLNKIPSNLNNPNLALPAVLFNQFNSCTIISNNKKFYNKNKSRNNYWKLKILIIRRKMNRKTKNKKKNNQ
jgi:hypothetical protein